MTENAAAVISEGAKVLRRSTKAKELTFNRSSLSSPFNCQWPVLPSGVTPAVLAQIKSTFQPLQCILAEKRSKNRKNTEKQQDEQRKTGKKSNKEKKRTAIRSQLSLGVNEVTRALEKGQLRLVMVCHSAKPHFMISHLGTLSVTRECPCMAVYHLSETLAPLLRMKSILAIGFKKVSGPADARDFDDFVAYVAARCPRIHVPWLDLKDHTRKELVEIFAKSLYKGEGVSKHEVILPVADEDPKTGTTGDTPQERNPDQDEYEDGDGDPEDAEALTKHRGEIMKEGNVLPEESGVAIAVGKKKRKLEEMSGQSKEGKAVGKRTNVMKMAYGSTTIKKVKIISKVLKKRGTKKK